MQNRKNFRQNERYLLNVKQFLAYAPLQTPLKVRTLGKEHDIYQILKYSLPYATQKNLKIKKRPYQRNYGSGERIKSYFNPRELNFTDI